MERVYWIYAVGRDLEASALEGLTPVDATYPFETISAFGLTAVCSEVTAEEFSQETIDRRSGDLEWLGRIGWAHQRVNQTLSTQKAIVPMRAFTLFSSPEKVTEFLDADSATLISTLDRVEGREEWTFRLDFDAANWDRALVHRVDSLRELDEEISRAPAGKAYLLRKKLDDAKKNAAREAETSLLTEIESELRGLVDAPLLVESRERRAGSSPQITLLLRRGDDEKLKSLESELASRHGSEGVSFTVTGPWPPYSFVGDASEE